MLVLTSVQRTVGRIEGRDIRIATAASTKTIASIAASCRMLPMFGDIFLLLHPS